MFYAKKSLFNRTKSCDKATAIEANTRISRTAELYRLYYPLLFI